MSKLCKQCILPECYPGISFDKNGICNHCHEYDEQWKNYNYIKSIQKLETILKKAKAKKRKYDCIVPLSGGLDSSYTLYQIKKHGLTPLAVNFDNGFQTDLAKNNIKKITKALDVDLKVIAPDRKMMKKLYRIFLLSGAEPCTPCELGGTGAIYCEALKVNTSLIVFGTSVRTEGITPKEVHYFDVRYFKNVIKKKKMPLSEVNKIFLVPNLFKMFYLQVIKGIKVIQLPYYMPWNENDIENFLTKRFGWEKGEKPHADCFFFPVRDYIRYKNWNFGARTQRLSAKIRDGQITRTEALSKVQEFEGLINDDELKFYLDYMHLTKADIESIRLKDYKQFKTYLPLLNNIKWLIKLFAKFNLLPENIEKKLG